MKLIMAVSKDGYVARKHDDDMSWTGPFDKAVFRLLTCVGGEIACGSRTAALMPRTLDGRSIHVLSRQPVKPYDPNGPVFKDLKWFQHHHPHGWLVGGQTIAMQALRADLVDEAFLCMSDRRCFPQASEHAERVILGDIIKLSTSHNVGWSLPVELKVGDCTVQVWRRNR